MVAFEVLAPPSGPTLGVVAHIPHGALTVPPEERRRLLLTPAQLEHELLVMTDRHTSELFALVVELGGVAFVNRTSRLVVDPERFPDDGQEPMARVGMGPVYTRTHHGRPLRSPDPAERARLLASYFEPYARALSNLVGTLLDRFGRCLIIDAHSFASRPLPYEPSQNSHQPAKARFSRSTLGCRAAMRSNARAGPSGMRLPCSQLRSVCTLIPRARANASWDSPVKRRRAATSSPPWSFPRTRRSRSRRGI